MKGYRINEDKEYVSKIVEGLEKKQGHCPCRVKVDETTLCPCDEFIETGICKCRLFVPIKNEEEVKKVEKTEEERKNEVKKGNKKSNNKINNKSNNK